jgi:hypothetical protein
MIILIIILLIIIYEHNMHIKKITHEYLIRIKYLF